MAHHEIQPKPGSAVRQGFGEPANLLVPGNYPALAICLGCGQMIRCARWLNSPWEHLTAGPLPAPDQEGQET